LKIKKTNIKQTTDNELISLYQKSKDKKYIGELYVRYSVLVMGVSLKYLKNMPDSQDNVMHVFEKLMNTLQTAEVRNFKPWLYQITKNECLMILRKKGKNIHISEENIQIVDKSNEKEEKQQKEELLNKLEETLPKLKKEQRECVELFYLQKKCYAQIVAQTNYSLKEVKSHIQNGKRNLQNLISK